MPRYRRAFITGYPYHIVQRGHDRQPVFAADVDHQTYLGNLAEQRAALNVKIFAFCLMTNHVHLIVQVEREGADLSKLMRVLAARQTRYTNALERRTGTLWEGRFKASLIDSEAYLLACCRYVDLNPVRAAMVSRPEEYPWSSHRRRAGYADTPVWLDDDPCYLALGDTPGARALCYRAFVSEGDRDEDLVLIRRAVQRNQLTGDSRFADAIAAKLGRRIEARGPGRPRAGEVA